jgi:hypothetical protein
MSGYYHASTSLISAKDCCNREKHVGKPLLLKDRKLISRKALKILQQIFAKNFVAERK